MAQSKFVKILLILANLFMFYMEALYKRFVPEERKSIRDKVSLFLQSLYITNNHIVLFCSTGLEFNYTETDFRWRSANMEISIMNLTC